MTITLSRKNPEIARFSQQLSTNLEELSIDVTEVI